MVKIRTNERMNVLIFQQVNLIITCDFLSMIMYVCCDFKYITTSDRIVRVTIPGFVI